MRPGEITSQLTVQCVTCDHYYHTYELSKVESLKVFRLEGFSKTNQGWKCRWCISKEKRKN